MKDLYKYINESILDDEDVFLDNVDKSIIEKFIKDNYKYKSIIISDKPNKDGKYEVSSKNDIEIKNYNITSLTNSLFVWDKVDGLFDCGGCNNLTSLEGAPKKIGRAFYCNDCDNLVSLKGAPKKVVGLFDCSDCSNLSSLEGVPKKIGRTFYCHSCASLKSLEGVPKEVGGDFYCYGCGGMFKIEDVKKLSKVKGSVYC